ncbi:glyoxylase-like metal-dependent hydrolase (beta-lactamase superfamily II) [Streptacidiphilus sp. MAP12-16]|uniref:MBL fold metallo-hydrolase n=1 Tax=Streptacidiphilus sp. MAP12-16 TaxID=3156300 RepID=UPI003512F88D
MPAEKPPVETPPVETPPAAKPQPRALPAPPATQDIGGGVWSITVPIPDNPLRYTLVYLLESDRGPVLVDTGWDDPAGRTALAEGLDAAGFSLADVHGVLVTHHHPDHHGLSAHVQEQSGAWIAMHGAEAKVVRALHDTRPARWLGRMAELMRTAGVPQEHLDGLSSFGSSGAPIADTVPDRELVHGESAGVPGRDLRVLWTPGHTPGHVCLYLNEPDHPSRLLSGDHLLPTISPIVSLYPENPGDEPTDPLGDFLDSLERIAALAPAEVLPAHQYRFADAPGRVRELLDHHAVRLADLLTQLKHEPLTLWQAAQRMHWNRPWEELGFIPRHLALSEAAAHVRRLVKTGLAEELSDTEPALYRAL